MKGLVKDKLRLKETLRNEYLLFNHLLKMHFARNICNKFFKMFLTCSSAVISLTLVRIFLTRFSFSRRFRDWCRSFSRMDRDDTPVIFRMRVRKLWQVKWVGQESLYRDTGLAIFCPSLKKLLLFKNSKLAFIYRYSLCLLYEVPIQFQVI